MPCVCVRARVITYFALRRRRMAGQPRRHRDGESGATKPVEEKRARRLFILLLRQRNHWFLTSTRRCSFPVVTSRRRNFNSHWNRGVVRAIQAEGNEYSFFFSPRTIPSMLNFIMMPDENFFCIFYLVFRAFRAKIVLHVLVLATLWTLSQIRCAAAVFAFYFQNRNTELRIRHCEYLSSSLTTPWHRRTDIS